MTELRDYQRELLGRVETALAPDGVRVMMQLPTGGGKTVIAAHLLADWLRDGRKAVWLTHRKELAEQTRDMLADARISAMTDIRWDPGNDAPAMSHGVVILMAQTVSRRTARMSVWNEYGKEDLLVIDEAHHAAAKGWERAMQQWPGRIVGMTATPWRLSKKEGFDHLFGELVCGPQTSELQTERWLCEAQMLMPQSDHLIRGGEVDHTGDYTEAGIERANRDRPDVMTAQALKFWKQHARQRQTVIYAVSVGHAKNLAAVFNDAGIRTAVLLGSTSPVERAQQIEAFKGGTLKVLVNVEVATEGFDLPDAGCVVLARPTMSLALYLQMVGRGLRPKDDGSDCLIHDLAGNSRIHGLPETARRWSLRPHGEQTDGGAPVIWCPYCDTVSSASNHNCPTCGRDFGKDCSRCGKWRLRERWKLENLCGNVHELVCDLCHEDAHVQAHLPIPDQVRSLHKDKPTLSPTAPPQTEIAMMNDEMERRLAPLLQELLENERRQALGVAEDSRAPLRGKIETRETLLNDEAALDGAFSEYLDTLPDGQRPGSMRAKSHLYGNWEEDLKKELTGWKKELVGMESREIDRRSIVNRARERLLRLFRREAETAGLMPQDTPAKEMLPRVPESPPSDNGCNLNGSGSAPEEFTLTRLATLNLETISGRKIHTLKLPSGQLFPIKTWAELLVGITEWLVERGEITYDQCPIPYGKGTTPQIDKTRIVSKKGIAPHQRQVSNGLWLNVHDSAHGTIQRAVKLLERFGEDSSEFSVRLS